MSNRLRSLFEYQKFEQNPRLKDIIADTENSYSGVEIPLENLDMVAAAGEVGQNRSNSNFDEDLKF